MQEVSSKDKLAFRWERVSYYQLQSGSNYDSPFILCTIFFIDILAYRSFSRISRGILRLIFIEIWYWRRFMLPHAYRDITLYKLILSKEASSFNLKAMIRLGLWKSQRKERKSVWSWKRIPVFEGFVLPMACKSPLGHVLKTMIKLYISMLESSD